MRGWYRNSSMSHTTTRSAAPFESFHIALRRRVLARSLHSPSVEKERTSTFGDDARRSATESSVDSLS